MIRNCYVAVLTAVFLLFCLCSHAQRIFAPGDLNRPDHDEWWYYLGMSLSYNSSNIHTSKAPKFLQDDSVLLANPYSSGGIALGLLATLRINRRFELRTNPQLIIGGSKYISYTLKYPGLRETPEVKKNLPSTIISFPVHVKLNSDRIGNFRTYVLAGMKYDLDLASNSTARNADDMIKLKKNDYGIDVGLGFNFYLPYVTVSPEIKFGYGLSNIHSRDASLKYSNVFDKLQSRQVFFTINLED